MRLYFPVNIGPGRKPRKQVFLRCGSFVSGSCDSYNNTFTCSNGRCIDKQFVCLGLNPCGDSSDCTGSLEAAITFWESIVNSIKDFAWFLVIAIGIYVVIKFLHIYRKRHGSFESLPIIGSLFKKYDSHSTSQVTCKHVVPINSN